MMMMMMMMMMMIVSWTLTYQSEDIIKDLIIL